MSGREIITELENRTELLKLITESNDMVVLKFGAEWCKPCKKIEGLVNQWYSILPANIKCGILDVDECFDIYAFYKSKKIIPTIPAILRFNPENKSIMPDLCILSSNPDDITYFFNEIVKDA
jgi:thiol-disulfide isomerase/thioredoxin